MLFGQGGDDRLSGFFGDDLIDGGGGADLIDTGPGADIIDYNAASDSSPTAFDHIRDFEQGADKIDLSTIDANGSAPGNGAFIFIGSAAFSGVAGQARTASNAPDTTDLLLDIDGDQVADMTIRFDLALPLAATDLIA
jgi:Ca2+-binding RTX toxin-like protein